MDSASEWMSLASAQRVPPTCLSSRAQALADTNPSLVPEELHGEDIVAIGIVTTREVGAHRELTWYYGSSYHHSYEVGKQTRLPQGLRPEDPIVALGGRIPNECVCVLVGGA